MRGSQSLLRTRRRYPSLTGTHPHTLPLAPQDAKQQEKLKKQVRHIKGNNKNYQDQVCLPGVFGRTHTDSHLRCLLQIQKEIRRIGIEKENLRKDNERLKQDVCVRLRQPHITPAHNRLRC